MDEWTTEIPVEPGWYWSYGTVHSTTFRKDIFPPEFRIVKVRKIANGFAYVADGAFIYPHHSKLPILWKRLEEPRLPTVRFWQWLWAELGNIPVDDDGKIQEPFQEFPVGTDRETIWQWFEEEFDISLGEEIWK